MNKQIQTERDKSTEKYKRSKEHGNKWKGTKKYTKKVINQLRSAKDKKKNKKLKEDKLRMRKSNKLSEANASSKKKTK